MPSPIIVDAHQDLAWNILTFERDYTRSAEQSWQAEIGKPASLHNGDTLLGWPDYQRGRVAFVFSTLFASPERRRLGEWETQCYKDIRQAHHIYKKQVDAYRFLVDRHPDQFRLVETSRHVQEIVANWQSNAESHPVGLVMLMEGAEGIQKPSELAEWWEWGVRIIGPAWAGTRFCGGTREPGPLTEDGRELLKGMEALNFTLDLSHMDELSVRQSLDTYPGPMIASHANAAALINEYSGNRHLSDEIIRAIVERNGMIGVIPFCRFLDYGWKRGDKRDSLTLETLSSHIDHICQIAGDATHVGIGSDFDGGFGKDSAPKDVETIADLQKLVPILSVRGYTEEDVIAILGGNWLHHLQENLPNS